jgi:hypothetical protein
MGATLTDVALPCQDVLRGGEAKVTKDLKDDKDTKDDNEEGARFCQCRASLSSLVSLSSLRFPPLQAANAAFELSAVRAP